MYTKQEVSRQRQVFWTTFGQYMQPILSADGQKTNWINYKTGVAGINFKMDADSMQATISIVLSHQEEIVQAAHYQQLTQLKTMLHETLKEQWIWQPMHQDEHGRIISSVSNKITGVNINRNDDWPTLISFFKPRILALDAFWSIAKYGFDL